MNPQLQQLALEHPEFVQGISLVIGLIYCFAGYRVFKIVLGIIGFVLGAAFGVALAVAAAPDQPLWMLLGAAVGGVIGAVLLVVLWYLGLFVLGAAFLAAVASAASTAAGYQPHWILLVTVGVIGGVIAVMLAKPVIVFCTAFSGSWQIVTSAFYFAGRLNLQQQFEDPLGIFRAPNQHAALLGAWLVLGLLGVAVQYYTTRQPTLEEEPPARSAA